MGLNNLITITGGVGVDLFIGDPPLIPHPVVGLGWWIAFLEKRLNRPKFTINRLKFHGILTVLTTLMIAFFIPFLILMWLRSVPWLFWPVNLWLMGTTIALKGLNQAGQGIYQSLSTGNLAVARLEVGKVVGRDTANLSVGEITRATVETIAENSVDGVIAPLIFGFLGGTPLAMLYRAVNTLDSMIGYKNDRYRHFGWAAARLDDLANLIPARICAFIMVISSFLLGFNWRNGIKVALRDARKHPSPNGGWPEAVTAGALGIRLGGLNLYQGIASFRSYLGDGHRSLEIADIKHTSKILNLTSMIFILITSGIMFIWMI